MLLHSFHGIAFNGYILLSQGQITSISSLLDLLSLIFDSCVVLDTNDNAARCPSPYPS